MAHVIIREPASERTVREPTQVVLDATLLALSEIRLTDLRVTRGWCHGKNVERIIDKVVTGHAVAADELANSMIGPRRAMMPRLRSANE